MRHMTFRTSPESLIADATSMRKERPASEKRKVHDANGSRSPGQNARRSVDVAVVGPKPSGRRGPDDPGNSVIVARAFTKPSFLMPDGNEPQSGPSSTGR